jgi:hypothetical protein
MTPGDAPGFYADHSELTIRLSNAVMAKLRTYRREMHPNRTDEQVVSYLVRDALVSLGVMEIPKGDRGKMAGKR